MSALDIHRNYGVHAILFSISRNTYTQTLGSEAKTKKKVWGELRIPKCRCSCERNLHFKDWSPAVATSYLLLEWFTPKTGLQS